MELPENMREFIAESLKVMRYQEIGNVVKGNRPNADTIEISSTMMSNIRNSFRIIKEKKKTLKRIA